MRKIWVISIILGIICLVGIFMISAYSKSLTEFQKTIGFILLCYIGVSLFAYGWMKINNNRPK